MTEFVTKLKKDGVFAKEVRSAGVAFHSYYMASIAPALLSALKKVILLNHRVLMLGYLHFSIGCNELSGVLSSRGEGTFSKSVYETSDVNS